MDKLGDLLVSFAARSETSSRMTEQLRAIHDEFIGDRDAEGGYFRMGFLAVKAIERCSQLEEGSDDHGTGNRTTDRAGTVPPHADPGPAEPR
jgi:hypothetical protein